MVDGVQCVMMDRENNMLTLYVDSWDLNHQNYLTLELQLGVQYC